MILDTSALVAILYREPEATAFAQLIHDVDSCRISVANYVELSMVVATRLRAVEADEFNRRLSAIEHGDTRL